MASVQKALEENDDIVPLSLLANTTVKQSQKDLLDVLVHLPVMTQKETVFGTLLEHMSLPVEIVDRDWRRLESYFFQGDVEMPLNMIVKGYNTVMDFLVGLVHKHEYISADAKMLHALQSRWLLFVLYVSLKYVYVEWKQIHASLTKSRWQHAFHESWVHVIAAPMGYTQQHGICGKLAPKYGVVYPKLACCIMILYCPKRCVFTHMHVKQRWMTPQHDEHNDNILRALIDDAPLPVMV